MAPADSATAAQLQYVRDDGYGIRRRRTGRGFAYRADNGLPVRDKATLARIRALVIPPAWRDVWISPVPNGHLQATGRDAKGRKQYRYHPRWRQVRDETKYERLIPFAAALPKIRQRVRQHLAFPGLPREKVLATQLRFQGKSAKTHGIAVTDRRLARLVRRLRDLPGQELFQYLDEQDAPQPITSADVNAYLREIAGEDFTAKDFRTWAGTILAARHLGVLSADHTRAGKAYAVDAVKAVAEQLGNTVAVCRSCYIHPLVLEALHRADVASCWKNSAGPRAHSGLSAEERSLVRFLRTQSTAEAA